MGSTRGDVVRFVLGFVAMISFGFAVLIAVGFYQVEIGANQNVSTANTSPR